MKHIFIYTFVLLAIKMGAQNPFVGINYNIHHSTYEGIEQRLDSCFTSNHFRDSVWFYRGLLYLKLEKNKKANDAYKQLNTNFPEFLEADYLHALILFSNADYARSIDEFTRVINRKPNHFHAIYDRSLAYGMLEDYKMAIADLDQLIKEYNNNANLFYSRAYWYEYTENLEAARKDYESCIKLNPRHFDAYLGLAYVLQTLKEPLKACETINQAMQQGSQIAEEIKQTFCK